MKLLKYFLLIIFFNIFVLNILYANENVSLELSVSKNEISIDETFDLNIILKIKGNTQISQNISVSGLDKFDEISNSIQNQVQIINGNTQQIYIFNKKLKPKEKGDFLIGPALIVINGNQLSSNSINIKVNDKNFINSENNNIKPKNDNFLKSKILIILILFFLIIISGIWLFFGGNENNKYSKHKISIDFDNKKNNNKLKKNEDDYTIIENKDIEKLFFEKLNLIYPKADFSTSNINIFLNNIKNSYNISEHKIENYLNLYKKIQKHKWSTEKYNENELKKEIEDLT